MLVISPYKINSMKKKNPLLLLLLLVVFSAPAWAQKPSFHIGGKFGANMNKVDGQSFKDGFTFGYQAGAFAELNFSKRFGIQPEVLWNESTVRTSTEFSDIYQELGARVTDAKLNYLTIPVLLNIRPSNFITLQAGPQYGILLNRNDNLLENGREAFRSGDFSMVGGVQLKLAMFRVYGRYVVGLQNLNDIDNQDRWRNQAIQLGVGLAL